MRQRINVLTNVVTKVLKLVVAKGCFTDHPNCEIVRRLSEAESMDLFHKIDGLPTDGDTKDSGSSFNFEGMSSGNLFK